MELRLQVLQCPDNSGKQGTKRIPLPTVPDGLNDFAHFGQVPGCTVVVAGPGVFRQQGFRFGHYLQLQGAGGDT